MPPNFPSYDLPYQTLTNAETYRYLGRASFAISIGPADFSHLGVGEFGVRMAFPSWHTLWTIRRSMALSPFLDHIFHIVSVGSGK